MYRNLSTFASRVRSSALSPLEPRRYLATTLVTTLSLLAIAITASLVTIRYNLFTWHFSSLFEYQVGKLQNGEHIDVLLLGDSSLGNGIDARLWSATEHSTVVSAALTGVYGYAGSLQMLRRATENRGVRVALIVQTPDMMTRPISHEGALFSAVDLKVLLEIPPMALLPFLLSMDVLKNLQDRVRRPRDLKIFEELAARDYIPQGTPLTLKDEPAPWKALLSETGKTYYLRKIVAYCRSAGIRCFYAHGPIANGLCSDAAGYYTSVAKLIAATGIELLSVTPPCLPLSDLGDSVDHAALDLRPKLTEHYRNMLRSRLLRESK